MERADRAGGKSGNTVASIQNTDLIRYAEKIIIDRRGTAGYKSTDRGRSFRTCLACFAALQH
ncbi:MAG: hypothetical protein KAV83_04015, partial [Desulfobacterales bacterium]|nr:hypothetical protein [Desulfobacterales bacterium]